MCGSRKMSFVSAVDLLVLQLTGNEARPAFGEFGGVRVKTGAMERDSGTWIRLRRIDPDRPREGLVRIEKTGMGRLAALVSAGDLSQQQPHHDADVHAHALEFLA